MGSISQIIGEVKKVIVGKDRTLLWVLTTILARGHILLEDIPGVGKTTMALAFSKALGLSYSRVQFTPTCCPRTSPAIPSTRRRPAPWSTSPAPCSPTSS